MSAAYHYTFSDWQGGYVPEDAPPAEMLDNMPKPLPMKGYNPAWGKYSKSARKAAYTRDAKRRKENKETFRALVLPAIVDKLDAFSLHDAGITLRDAELIERSGYVFYSKGDRGQWFAPDDPHIEQAVALGAKPLPAESALSFYPNS